MKDAAFIEVEAGVRYWEDAIVNGVEDEDGSLIPCRIEDAWCPTIELATGRILGWPEGIEADIHYKVCDDGRYWLLNSDGGRIARYRSDYVPDAFLCHGDTGYADYIIMEVGGDGMIKDYQRPEIVADEWGKPSE